MRYMLPVEVVLEQELQARYVVENLDGQPVVRLFSTIELVPPKTPDIWELRTRFLMLRPSASVFAEFLSDAGPWRDQWDGILPVDYLSGWQRALKVLMNTSPELWQEFESSYEGSEKEMLSYAAHSASFWTRFSWRARGQAYIRLQPNDLLDAIITTIWLDAMSNSEFRWCAEENCGKPFTVAGKSRKRYCSRECGHRAVVKRGRAPNNKTALRWDGSLL